MAEITSTELQSQLDIQMQMNSVLQERSDLLKRQVKTLTTQAELAVELCRALECDELDKVASNLEDIRRSLTDATNRAEDFGATTTQQVAKANEQVSKTSRGVQGIIEQFGTAKFAATGFGLGLIDGFKAGVAQIGALKDLVFSVVRGISSLTLGIIGIPFGMLSGLISMANEGGGGNELRQAYEEVRKQFGHFATNEAAAVISGFKEIRKQAGNVAGTGISLYKMFGSVAASLQAVNELATEMGAVFSMLQGEFAKSAGYIISYQKALGLSGEMMKAFGTRAVTSGKDITEVLNETAKISLHMSDRFGISAKLISRDMGEMAADFENFGTLSQKELAQTAVFARKLGIEVKELTGLIDKFDNFEDAAEGAAMMAQAFGMNVDAIGLMNAQNPAERIDQLRQSFFATGKSMEAMSRQEKKLLATTTGLSGAALDAAFSAENMGMSYDDVKAAGEDAEKQQLSQTDAMIKLAGAIERVINSGDTFNSFFEALFGGFQKGLKRWQPFRKLLRNIVKSLRVTYQFGKKLGRQFGELFPGFKEFIVGLQELFDPKKLRKFLMGDDGVLGVFKNLFTDLQTDPKAGIENFIKSMGRKLDDFFGSKGEMLDKIKSGFITIAITIIKSFAYILPMIVKNLTKFVNTLTDFITGAGGFSDPTGIIAAIKPALIDAFESLKVVLPDLLKSLKGLFYTLFKKFEPEIMMIGKYVLGAIIGKMLLVGFVRAIKAGGLRALGGMLLKVFEMIVKPVKAAGATMEKVGGTADKLAGAMGGADAKVGSAKQINNSIKVFADIDTAKIAKAGPNMLILALFATASIVTFGLAIFLYAAAMKKYEIDPKYIYAGSVAIASSALSVLIIAKAAGQIKERDMGKGIKGLLSGMGLLAAITAFYLPAMFFLGKMLLAMNIKWKELVIGFGGMISASLTLTVLTFALWALGKIAQKSVKGVVVASAFTFVLLAYVGGLMLLASIMSYFDIKKTVVDIMGMVIITTALVAMAAIASLLVGLAKTGLSGIGVAVAFTAILLLLAVFLPTLNSYFEDVGSIEKLVKNTITIAVFLVALSAIGFAASLMIAVAGFGIPGLGLSVLFLMALAPFLDLVNHIAPELNNTAALEGMAKALPTVALIFGAIAIIAMATTVAGGLALVAIPGLLFMVAFIGVLGFGVIPAVNALGESMPSISELKKVGAKAEALIPFFKMMVLVAMSALMLTAFAHPFFFGDSEDVFKTMAEFTKGIQEYVVPSMITLSKMPLKGGSDMEKKIGLISKIMEGLSGFAEVAVSAAEIEADAMDGGRISGVLKRATDFIEDMGINIASFVRILSAIKIDESSIKRMMAVTDILGAVGKLLNGMQLGKMLDLFKDVIKQVEPQWLSADADDISKMQVGMTVIRQQIEFMIMGVFEALATSIPKLVNALLDLLNKPELKNINEMKPKIETLAAIIGIVVDFGKMLTEIIGMAQSAGGTGIRGEAEKHLLSIQEKISAFVKVFPTITNALVGKFGLPFLVEGITKITTELTEDKIKEFKRGMPIIKEIIGLIGTFSGILSELSKLESTDKVTNVKTSIVNRMQEIIRAIVGGVGKGALNNKGIAPLINGIKVLVDNMPTDKGFTKKLRNFADIVRAIESVSGTFSKFTGKKAIDASVVRSSFETLGMMFDPTFGMGTLIDKISAAVSGKKGLNRLSKKLKSINSIMKEVTNIGKALNTDLKNTTIDLAKNIAEISEQIKTIDSELAKIGVINIGANVKGAGRHKVTANKIMVKPVPLNISFEATINVDAKQLASSLSIDKLKGDGFIQSKRYIVKDGKLSSKLQKRDQDLEQARK